MNARDLRSVAEWCRSTGQNYNTMKKRRAVAGVGMCVPPGTWLLSKKEWEIVQKTPLAGCVQVKK